MITKFLKYGVAGGTAFVLDFALVYILFTYTTWHYSIVVVLAFIFGTLVNYTVNRLWGFKETTQGVTKGYIYFLCIALIGILFTLGLMVVMIEYLQINKLLARIIAAGLVFIWSFAANHFLNFKTHKSQATKASDVLQ